MILNLINPSALKMETKLENLTSQETIVQKLIHDKEFNTIFTLWCEDSSCLDAKANPVLFDKCINQQFLFTLLNQPETIVIEAFEQGLSLCLDVNAINNEGKTLLTTAIETNQLDVVRCL